MDGFHDHAPRLDVDADVAGILERWRALQDRQGRRRGFSDWQVALAGSQTGVGLVPGGIVTGRALLRAVN